MRRVDQRRCVPQHRLAPAHLRFGKFWKPRNVRHVTDQSEGCQPQKVRLVTQHPGRPPSKQRRRGFGIKTVTANRHGSLWLSRWHVMVDHEGRAAGKYRLRTGAEICHDQTCGPQCQKAVTGVRFPWYPGFPITTSSAVQHAWRSERMSIAAALSPSASKWLSTPTGPCRPNEARASAMAHRAAA
jgi:hypothetical protein